MTIRGLRGATTVSEDQPDQVLEATKEMLAEIMKVNPTLKTEDVASALFTVTGDVISTFPAKAAREMGWQDVPLMCALEIPVPDSLGKCIRVLIHWNADLPQSAIRHVYLNKASGLRPDLSDSKNDS